MKESNKKGEVVSLHSSLESPIHGHVAGRIVGQAHEGFLVEFSRNSHGPIRARSIVPGATLRRACRTTAQPEVLLVFEEGRADRPLILGLINAASEPTEEVEAFVDGRRIVLEGKDEIVLKCGKAIMVMRRNGRVSVRGTHVEIDSDGVNRIRGGKVQVN